eukprot:1278996-Prorocentrum_lima.AAC.1
MVSFRGKRRGHTHQARAMITWPTSEIPCNTKMAYCWGPELHKFEEADGANKKKEERQGPGEEAT